MTHLLFLKVLSNDTLYWDMKRNTSCKIGGKSLLKINICKFNSGFGKFVSQSIGLNSHCCRSSIDKKMKNKQQ